MRGVLPGLAYNQQMPQRERPDYSPRDQEEGASWNDTKRLRRARRRIHSSCLLLRRPSVLVRALAAGGSPREFLEGVEIRLCLAGHQEEDPRIIVNAVLDEARAWEKRRKPIIHGDGRAEVSSEALHHRPRNPGKGRRKITGRGARESTSHGCGEKEHTERQCPRHEEEGDGGRGDCLPKTVPRTV